MIFIDRACYERGCACYDSRVDEDPVEVVAKREWVGLTDEEKKEIYNAQRGFPDVCKAIEAKLKEKNK